MRIELKCRCGATAVFADDRGAFCKFNFGQNHDEKGRRYLIEVRADEWQERHKGCLTAGVMVDAAPQIDESKLPPRPTGSNDANTDPDSPLKRYGRASKESGLLLEPMADGYWTPWHIANEMLREAQRNAGVGASDGKVDCTQYPMGEGGGVEGK